MLDSHQFVQLAVESDDSINRDADAHQFFWSELGRWLLETFGDDRASLFCSNGLERNDLILFCCKMVLSMMTGMVHRVWFTAKHFLADRTNGRTYGTVLRPSVCLSSVTLCIVAKRCVLAKVTIDSL